MHKLKIRVSAKQVWLSPPPWNVLDGALLEFWAEMECTQRAWMERLQTAVSEKELARHGGDEGLVRDVHAAAAAIRLRQIFEEVADVVQRINPATLSLGHRAARKIVLDYLADPTPDPYPVARSFDPNGPLDHDDHVLAYAKRAMGAVRAFRQALRDDGEKDKVRREAHFVVKQPQAESV